MQRTFALATGAALLSVGALAAGSAPATAASSPATSGARQATERTAGSQIMQRVDRVNVPDCVKFKTDFSGATDHLYITNECRKAKHVKVILDSQADFECQKINSGDGEHYWWGWPAKVNKVKGC
ncbi:MULTISPECIES: hypothetical protein [Streptomyces]|uniref:hypothetical protein n=1 Tax=Streptomyces lycopersici TaxID=2974589 RepID=UPI0021D2A089|nr:hypothetical protein [Streptomyces sp. NEAU-383]